MRKLRERQDRTIHMDWDSTLNHHHLYERRLEYIHTLGRIADHREAAAAFARLLKKRIAYSVTELDYSSYKYILWLHNDYGTHTEKRYKTKRGVLAAVKRLRDKGQLVYGDCYLVD